MVIQVLVKHYIPFFLAEFAKGKRLPPYVGIFTRGLCLPHEINQSFLLRFKIPLIIYNEDWGRAGIFGVGFRADNSLLHKCLEHHPHEGIGLGMLVGEGHFVSDAAVGQHLGHVHLAPLGLGFGCELLYAVHDLLGYCLLEDVGIRHEKMRMVVSILVNESR